MKRAGLICMIVGFTFVFAFNTLAGPVIDRIVKKGELVVGISGNQPPLNATSKEGEIIGLEADLAKIFADAMGVKLKFEVMPFKELLPSLKDGKVDMVLSGMTITPERNLQAAFVGPYFISGKSIITTKEKAQSIESAADINNSYTTLTALEGSTSQNFVKNIIPQAKLLTTKNYDAALELLLQGKADAMVADFPFCILSSFRYQDKNLVAVDKPFTYEPVGVALPPNDPLLVNVVENTLLTIEGSGALLLLTENWFKDPAWLQKLP